MPEMTKEEYEKKFHENYRITGEGFETTIHSPCPFCAAPDYQVYRVLDVQAALAKETFCTSCERGTKSIVTRTANSTSVQMVQTQGDDPPSYIPIMRRVDADT